MVIDFGEAIAPFVAMPEIRQIVQAKQLITTSMNRRSIGLEKGSIMSQNRLITKQLFV